SGLPLRDASEPGPRRAVAIVANGRRLASQGGHKPAFQAQGWSGRYRNHWPHGKQPWLPAGGSLTARGREANDVSYPLARQTSLKADSRGKGVCQTVCHTFSRWQTPLENVR